MLYIANCETEITQYRLNGFRVNKIHIIEADNEIEANDKIQRYYEQKNNSYSIDYSVTLTVCDLEPIIK